MKRYISLVATIILVLCLVLTSCGSPKYESTELSIDKDGPGFIELISYTETALEDITGEDVSVMPDEKAWDISKTDLSYVLSTDVKIGGISKEIIIKIKFDDNTYTTYSVYQLKIDGQNIDSVSEVAEKSSESTVITPFQKVVDSENSKKHGDLLNEMMSVLGKGITEGRELTAEETSELDSLLTEFVDCCDDIVMSIFQKANSEGRLFSDDEKKVLLDMYQQEVEYNALISTKTEKEAYDEIFDRHFLNMLKVGEEAGISDKTVGEMTEAEKIISDNTITLFDILMEAMYGEFD